MSWVTHARAGRVLAITVAVLTATAVANGVWFVAPARADSVTTLEFDGSAQPWIGATYYWTVPDHVSKVTFSVYGAQGGADPCGGIMPGGLGGRTVATLDVQPGWVFQLNVGSPGAGNNSIDCNASGQGPVPGGWNGGGNGGRNADDIFYAAGGGGASDVRLGLYGLSDRDIVAGGGGGAADIGYNYDGTIEYDPYGGYGGGLVGGAGHDGGGGGGTQTSGGYSGLNSGGGVVGQPGSFGAGGNGADAAYGHDGQNSIATGGGGGGGWYGGGGGGSGLFGSGGGGGSGYITSSTTLNPSDTALYANDHSGPGKIILSYTPDEPIVLPPDVDFFPPTLTLPDDIVVDATSPAGAIVDYSFSATDTSGVVTSSCTPASGSTFPIGVTTVTCSATDPYDHTATGTFTVTVLDDTTPPTLTLPADIVVDATGPSGATVDYSFSASDEHGILSSGCAPASGSVFPIGMITVNCTATDTFGNTASGSFQVTVKGADDQIEVLTAEVSGNDVGTSLADKLQQAGIYLQSGDVTDACATLNAFIQEVEAQTGKKISAADAASLIASVLQIEAVTAC